MATNFVDQIMDHVRLPLRPLVFEASCPWWDDLPLWWLASDELWKKDVLFQEDPLWKHPLFLWPLASNALWFEHMFRLEDAKWKHTPLWSDESVLEDSSWLEDPLWKNPIFLWPSKQWLLRKMVQSLQMMAENSKDKEVWLHSASDLSLNVNLVELGDIVFRCIDAARQSHNMKIQVELRDFLILNLGAAAPRQLSSCQCHACLRFIYEQWAKKMTRDTDDWASLHSTMYLSIWKLQDVMRNHNDMTSFLSFLQCKYGPALATTDAELAHALYQHARDNLDLCVSKKQKRSGPKKKTKQNIQDQSPLDWLEAGRQEKELVGAGAVSEVDAEGLLGLKDFSD